MTEPTVLDYVKEKLAFWRKGTLWIPSLEEVQTEEEPSDSTDLIGMEVIEAPSEELEFDFGSIRVPWKPLVAICSALIAQRLLEPPSPDIKLAVGFYIIAFGMAIWSLLVADWQIAGVPDDLPLEDDLKFNWVFALAALPLALLTFFTFASGRFEEINLILWTLTIMALVVAFWRSNTKVRSVFKSIGTWIVSWPKTLRINTWHILMGISILVILYFRIHQLETVPPEMTSDHAEKLQDVEDVLRGIYSVYFTRNTGREAFQFYLTALVSKGFGTGVSFLSLKIGTTIAGLAILPFIYYTGKELGSRRAGFLAMFLAGIAYWPNVISRVGLRFSLYPLFVAPTLYFFLRGLRTKNRNDAIWTGIFLGMGLHGYTPFRIVPFLIVIGILLYLISTRNSEKKIFTIAVLVIIVLLSFSVFLPLFRYSIDNAEMFYYRSLTRVGTIERSFPGSPVEIFFHNLWNAMLMFGYNDGDTWLHSVPNRPALDIVSASLFYVGLILLLVRYLLKRRWQDLFLLISIPVLMLPSILSLAFPNENPALNRTAGALVPAFLIIGLTLDGFLNGVEKSLPGTIRKGFSTIFTGLLLLVSMTQNYHLVFTTYLDQYKMSAGNTTEVGIVLKNFAESVGTPDTVWIIGYPNWIDTRLPAIVAGYPIKDYAIWPDDITTTLNYPGPKLFIINPADLSDISTLQSLYPRASTKMYTSTVPGRDFLIMLVPAE